MKFIRRTPPPPHNITWDDYSTEVSRAWDKLLASDPEESAVHDFLERHPCLLPDPYGMFGGGHNGLRGGVIYSKPLLPGARPLVPDFMYVASDSATISPVMIEIEAPTKSACTTQGQATAELTQARAQLTDWATWFAEDGNTAAFQKLYGITNVDLRSRSFVPRYVLIFGRRADVEANLRFAKARAGLSHTEMTYDRLAPSPRYAGWPVARTDTSYPGDFRFRLVASASGRQ